MCDSLPIRFMIGEVAKIELTSNLRRRDELTRWLLDHGGGRPPPTSGVASGRVAFRASCRSRLRSVASLTLAKPPPSSGSSMRYRSTRWAEPWTASAAIIPRGGTLLGHLFESLVTLSVRVYAQASEAQVKHLRTKGGRHEVDLIIERADGRALAMEVKLARTVSDDDVKHLLWLRDRMGRDLLDAVVVTTGAAAYRRADGVGVIPAALLGP